MKPYNRVLSLSNSGDKPCDEAQFTAAVALILLLTSAVFVFAQQACDPNRVCGQAFTCVDGWLYSDTCACGQPVGRCDDARYEEPPWDLTVDFSVLPSGVSAPPSFQIAGMTFFAHVSEDFYGGPYIFDWGPPSERSYGFPDEGVTVVLPLEAWAVEVRLCRFGSDVLIEAYTSAGAFVTQELAEANGSCDDFLLPSDSSLISVVRLTGGNYEASIARLSVDEHEMAIPMHRATSSAMLQSGGVASLSAGNQFTCRILDTGVVECWGAYESRPAPPGTFTSVSTSGGSTCGVRPTGVVECWGQGGHGEDKPPAGTFTSVSVGGDHTCGVRSTGAVECWGNNDYGQSSPPAGTFTSVSAVFQNTCGVRSTGAVECWGNSAASPPPPTDTFVSVSAGGNHICGVRTSGWVECWGHPSLSSPPSGTFVSVSAGHTHTCGIRPAGTVECWGWDNHGESSPPSGTFVSVSAGTNHTCGIRPTGAVECWGWDNAGQSSPP